jgi:16S rRNA (cytosine967-C5)-methyltransferase
MAAEILHRVEFSGALLSDVLYSPKFERLSPQDRGLATEIALGVLRSRGELDDRIADSSSRPVASLDPEVLTALRIGTYQILHLDRVPARAAVNESVELVKAARKRSATGFVNAVLRRVGPPISSRDIRTGSARSSPAICPPSCSSTSTPRPIEPGRSP